jgi:hypothetical protein
MKKLMTWTLFFLMPALTAFAGGETGNGGDGILRDNKVYLLDLVEAGTELTPYFNKSDEPDGRINAFLKKKLPIENTVIELISRKTKELYLKSPSLAYHVLAAINLYSWQFLNTHLRDVPDDGDTIIDIPYRGDLVQLAVRYKKEVKIDKSYWLFMDDANRAALILHEALYALIQPHIDEDGNNAKQSSLDTRRLVGLLFGENFDREALQTFLSSLGTLDAYPRMSDLGGTMLPNMSAVKNINSQFIGEFYVKYEDGAWYTAHAQLLEGNKEEFCQNPKYTEFRALLWIPMYSTYWYPLSSYFGNGFTIPNGYFSWRRFTQTIDKNKNYDECKAMLSNWKAVDPLDHLL